MIFNINSGPVRKTPVLDSAYPKNVTVDVGASATFKVVIAEDGKPAEYTYQWYYDGNAVSGATKSTYSRSAAKGSHTVYCMVTNKAGSVKSRTATVTADTQWLYNAGTFSSAAGSLKQTGVQFSGNAGSCTLKQNASNVTIGTLANSGALVYFTKQIDLTNYSTLYFNGSVVDKENYGNNRCAIGVWKTIPTSSDTVDSTKANAAAAITGFRANGTYQIDISNCSGNHYVGIAVRGFGTADMPYIVVTMNQMYLK